MNYLLKYWHTHTNDTLVGFNSADNVAASTNSDMGGFNHTETVSVGLPDILTADDLSLEMTTIVFPVTLLIAIEALFGTIGNLFILIIYYKWYKVCSFRCFVLYMACIDLTSCLTTLPGEIVSQLNWYSYPSDGLCKAKSFFNVFTVWSSGLVLLWLAYDRYRKICHPLSWQIPVQVSARLCLASILFAGVIASPTAVLWGKQSYTYIDFNTSVSVSICEKSDSYAYGAVPLVYALSAFVTPMIIIMLITAAFNVCTGQKLLIGLRSERDKSRIGECHMLPIENDSGSFQFGSVAHMNREVHQEMRAARRYSFPVGKLSLRRTALLQKLSQFRLIGGRQHRNIPKTKSDVIRETKHVYVFPKRKARPNRQRYLSDSAITASPITLRYKNKWPHRFTGNRLNSRRRKTLIMLVLSGVFIVTMSLYLGLVSIVATTVGALRELSTSQKVVFFFFWRLYFLNSLINPILYGFMDQRFRQGLLRLVCSREYFQRPTNNSYVNAL